MIEIEHLSKSFGPIQAVRDLCLSVPRGELFCFLGPNGAGKTTTLKILTGLLRPSFGRVRIGGIDITHDPVGAKRLMAYIPDTPFLYDRLTTTEFFLFAGDMYGMPPDRTRQQVDPFFVQFGLMDYRNALIQDLSHGLRQRLIYAVSFLHDPQVLFIDEPLVGLDPHTIRMIKELLKAKARGGMTIFLTTHILALAEDVADRIGIISNGQLIALGTLNELRKHAKAGDDLEDIFLSLTLAEA